MNSLIEYMQWQHLNIDDVSLNVLCKELLNQVINSPNLIGTTFQLSQYNNINFAIEKINASTKPICEKTDNDTFILKGFKEYENIPNKPDR